MRAQGLSSVLDMLDFAYPTVLGASSPGGRLPCPGEVWSLWDVHQIYTANLVEAARYIGALEQWVKNASDEERSVCLLAEADGTVDDIRFVLGPLIEVLQKLGARVTIQVCQELDTALNDEDFTYAHLGEFLSDAVKTLKRETREVSLYSIDSRYAGYIERPDPPFGNIDLSKFGGAAGEIAEAAKCLALRRNKAVVFHLMLALEEVVRVLASARGATVQDANGKWLTWLTIANNIDNQVIRLLPEGATKVAWHDANSLLKSVGHAWRNPTDHPGGSYSEEDAQTIFDSVKSFMRKLTPLV